MLFGVSTGHGNRKNIENWLQRGAQILAIDWDVGHLLSGGMYAYNNVCEIIINFNK